MEQKGLEPGRDAQNLDLLSVYASVCKEEDGGKHPHLVLSMRKRGSAPPESWWQIGAAPKSVR